MKFVHLHTHSHYSLLDGLSKIGDLVKKGKETGMDSMAITDHGSMYGAIEFYQKAKKAGIKPIIGCLPPGHLIYTNKGMKPIEEIEKGNLVLTHKGRFRKVVRTMRREHVGHIYGIKATNSNTVWITGEHPILTTNSDMNEPSWTRADRLEHGRKNKRGGVKNWKTYAALPKLREEIKDDLYPIEYLESSTYGVNENKISKLYKFNKYDSLGITSLPTVLPVTHNLAYFFGLFLAEGSFQHDPKGRPTSLTFSF